MRKPFYISTFLFLGMMQSFAGMAQAPDKAKAPDAGRLPQIEFQADALSLGDTVSISKLKEQKIARVGIHGDTSDLGFSVLSYVCILITKEGPKKVTVNGNSLAAVTGILASAKPGNFLFFSDIKIQMRESGTAVFLENKSCWLKE